MTKRAQNADFRRKPQIFADSLLLLEVQAFGECTQPRKTADFRRKPKIFAENRMKPQRFRHLRCVTFSSALDLGGGQKLVDEIHVLFLVLNNPFFKGPGRSKNTATMQIP